MKLGADPQPILFGHLRPLGDVSRTSFFVTIENSNFQSAFTHPAGNSTVPEAEPIRSWLFKLGKPTPPTLKCPDMSVSTVRVTSSPPFGPIPTLADAIGSPVRSSTSFPTTVGHSFPPAMSWAVDGHS